MEMNRQITLNQGLRFLNIAISTTSLYGIEHPQIKQHCKSAHGCLLEAFGENSSLALLRVDDQLAVGDQALPASLYATRFARLLKTRGIGHIKFLKAVTVEDLHRFTSALARPGEVIHSSENLRLGQVEVRYRSDSVEGQFKLPKNAHMVLDEVSNEELVRIMEVYEAVKHNRSVNLVGLSEIVTNFIDIFASYSQPLLAMVPLRSMDEYTFTHSLNVCLLNLAQAKTLGIEGPLLHDIGLAAMLHDVGKLFIPEEVLNKTEKLDDSEWELMQQHPIKGAEYLLKTSGVPRMAVTNAYEHHMGFDMRGYPRVDAHWKPSLCSHMTSISDIYDSLRTRRPYRDPLDVETTLKMMVEQSGTQLHPALTENFLNLIYRISQTENDKVEN